jgi:hypothetical protein
VVRGEALRCRRRFRRIHQLLPQRIAKCIGSDAPSYSHACAASIHAGCERVVGRCTVPAELQISRYALLGCEGSSG